MSSGAFDNYIQPGMNITKCEFCGYDRKGQVDEDGGNVFVPVSMDRYETVRHDGYWEVSAKCTKGHTTKIKFIHPLAPQTDEESIRQVQEQFGRYFA